MTYFRDEQGNYVRTVTCSHCWDRGHNISSCPDRAKKIEKDRKENGDDGYYVAQYDREQRNRKKRSCSYCGGEGHNVTTCEKLKTHLESEINRSVVYRALAYEHIKTSGLGIGALVHVAEYYDEHYNNVPAVGFITHIMWDRITHENLKNYYGAGCFVAKMQIKDRYGHTNLEISLPYHPDLCYSERQQHEYDIAVPSDKVEPPDDWLAEPDKDMVRRFRQNLREETCYYVERRLEQEAEARQAEEQAVA